LRREDKPRTAARRGEVDKGAGNLEWDELEKPIDHGKHGEYGENQGSNPSPSPRKANHEQGRTLCFFVPFFAPLFALFVARVVAGRFFRLIFRVRL
jgi:hypothetical protein